MDYFILVQDRRIADAIEPAGLGKMVKRVPFHAAELVALDEQIVPIYLKSGSHKRYIDFIENPVTLVSDQLKQILEKYEPKLFFKPMMLMELGKRPPRQELYWLMAAQRIDCLSPQSEFNINGTLKRLVIDDKKISREKIFQIKGIIEDLLLIRLDVAESLLRRDFTGIKLKKVQLAE